MRAVHRCDDVDAQLVGQKAVSGVEEVAHGAPTLVIALKKEIFGIFEDNDFLLGPVAPVLVHPEGHELWTSQNRRRAAPSPRGAFEVGLEPHRCAKPILSRLTEIAS